MSPVSVATVYATLAVRGWPGRASVTMKATGSPSSPRAAAIAKVRDLAGSTTTALDPASDPVLASAGSVSTASRLSATASMSPPFSDSASVPSYCRSADPSSAWTA